MEFNNQKNWHSVHVLKFHLTTPQLLQEARENREAIDQCQGPLLIHCSAGIGRTGTLIVIDQCLQGLVQHHQVDMNLLIEQAREDRMGLVQHTGFGLVWFTTPAKY